MTERPSRRARRLTVCCSLLLAACATVRDRPACDLVIDDVTLFDGATVTAHANVYVRGGTVAAINGSTPVVAGSCAAVVQGAGKTLVPGLINAHVHPESPAHLQEAARAGVLTVLDLFAASEDRIPQLQSLASSPQYAYYHSAGIGADMPGGVIAATLPHLSIPHPTEAESAAEFIRTRVRNGAQFIKIFQDSGSRRITSFPDPVFGSLISEAHRQERVVTVHIGTLKDARQAFDRGADVLAHLWRGQDGTATGADLERWRMRPFYITPTLLPYKRLGQPRAPRLYPVPFETYLAEVGRLHRADIPLLASTDATSAEPGINMGTDLYRELEMFVQAGMTAVEALQTATINPARAFGLAGRGVITRGASADFVLVNGDVVNDIQALNNVEAVWKQGMRIR